MERCAHTASHPPLTPKRAPWTRIQIQTQTNHVDIRYRINVFLTCTSIRISKSQTWKRACSYVVYDPLTNICIPINVRMDVFFRPTQSNSNNAASHHSPLTTLSHHTITSSQHRHTSIALHSSGRALVGTYQILIALETFWKYEEEFIKTSQTIVWREQLPPLRSSFTHFLTIAILVPKGIAPASTMVR